MEARASKSIGFVKVSVIIPNYNHARFLDERIQSVLNQKYDDFEVILLDDASTDESVEVLRRYSDHPKVRHLVLNKDNSGSTFKQWQKGIELANGDWIWIAESDDVADLSFLEKLTKRITLQTGLVYCRSLTIDKDSQVQKKGYFWPDHLDEKRWKCDFESEGIQELSQYMLYLNTIPNASSVIFRKDLVPDWEEIIKMRYAGDWLFWSMLMKGVDVAFVSEALNFFRKHDATSREVQNREAELRRFKEYALVIGNNFEATSTYRRLNKIEIEWKNFSWLFNEVRNRTSVLGKSALFNPPVHGKLRLHFWKSLLSKN